MKIATTSKAVRAAALLAAAAGGALAALLFWPVAPPPVSTNQVLGLLPRGSSVHSLVRLEMDGRGPAEAAVVARIPGYPGSRDLTPTALLYRYDRWRRAFREFYRAPAPGAVPFSADAGRLLGAREAALFSGLDDDGALRYRVVGWARRRATVLREERLDGTVRVDEPLLIERTGIAIRALRWTGRGWSAAEPPEAPPDPPPAVTWRYAVRGGAVAARTDVVRLRPRQALRVASAGGGPASVVLPDPRLDIVEAGFRSRTPGTYRIRIVTGFTPPESAYVLTVIVER